MTQQWAKENRASTSCIMSGNSDNQIKALPRVPGRQERTVTLKPTSTLQWLARAKADH